MASTRSRSRALLASARAASRTRGPSTRIHCSVRPVLDTASRAAAASSALVVCTSGGRSGVYKLTRTEPHGNPTGRRDGNTMFWWTSVRICAARSRSAPTRAHRMRIKRVSVAASKPASHAAPAAASASRRLLAKQRWAAIIASRLAEYAVEAALTRASLAVP